MPTLYGIPNCDTMKKARRWLDEAGVSYDFHDYKKHGIDAATLKGWCKQVGWEVLLNRRGTTWRRLSATQKQDVNEARAIALMVEFPAMIKRPVLDVDGRIEVGFSAEKYAHLFA